MSFSLNPEKKNDLRFSDILRKNTNNIIRHKTFPGIAKTEPREMLHGEHFWI